MKTRTTFVAVALAGTILAFPAFAEDNTSTIISGTVSNHGGADFYVGNTGTNNSLQINSSGVLSNVSNGYIGYSVGASNNFAFVTGAGSAWLNTNYLFVSYLGRGNSLTVSTGGMVWARNLYVGYTNGAQGTLTIANGGIVSNQSAYIGRYAGANDNTVTVTGTGSVWRATSFLILGYSSVGNTLIISNSGAVYNNFGDIGYLTGATSNIILVTGVGSVWSNSSYLRIGWQGSSNQLTIADGGKVFNTDGYIGTNSTASGNTVTVTGSNSFWRNNGNLTVGNEGAGNLLTMSSGGVVTNAGFAFIGYDQFGTNNAAVVTDAGSRWNAAQFLIVGNYGSGNSLTISNGGVVTTGSGISSIGNQLTGAGNIVTVTGSNSFWDNAGGLNVGSAGSSNSLNILNSGGVRIAGNCVVGSVPANSTNNLLLVASGGVLIVTNAAGSGRLDVRSGTLSIAGGSVLADGLMLTNTTGRLAFDSGQFTTTTGIVANGRTTIVGDNSGTARWTMLNGLHSFTNNLTLGNTAGSTGIVSVLGGTLVTTNGATMIPDYLTVVIGNNGVGQMTVSNATWQAQMVYIGNNTTGKGSLTILNGGFLNGYTIYVGSQGAGSSLIISNGGRVRNGYGYIGYNVGNNSNSAIVTGSGSSWTNTSEFMVGRNGSANSLTIANSGIVYSANSTIGLFTNTRSNTVTVTDSGSVWRNGGYLIVGLSGSSNQLTIADGGRVFNTHGSIGSNSAANGNAVLVTGSGSLWTNSGNVYVSCSGVGNSLTIEDGGRVTAQAMYIGLNGGSSGTLTINNGTNILSSSLTVGNAANSTGAVWLSGGFLCTSNNAVFIGNYGRGQMTVSNGSWLASDAYVGFRGGSQGTLTIAGGATILSSVLSVGTDANSTGTVWLTGGQLVTTNYSAAVGSSGVGEMTVSNGSWLAQAVNVGATASSRGTLTIAGGVTDLRSGLSIAYGAVFLTGGQLVTTNDSVWIGNFGSGRMIVSNGTWFAKDVCVGYGGYSVGLSGMLLVHGGAIGLAGPLTVGSDGAGYLTISGGVLGLHPDVATATNGTGFNVDGSVTLNDGRILVSNVATRIGNVATGTLTINGGTMTVFAPFTVGATSSATGTVLVAGGHLDLSATTTLIGPACLGQLIVTNTGVVTLGDVTIGSDGTLTVAGGTLRVADTLSDASGVNLLGGTVVVLPDGVLQLSHDVSSLVSNAGDIQVSASLSLLGGLQNQGNLSVNAVQVIKVENQMANAGSGVLYLNNGGILDVGPAWTNAAAIAFSQGGRLKGGSVANDGLLEGSGAISAPLLNRAGGTVRAANGVLALTGASVANEPGAFMEAVAGGTLRFSQSLNNQGIIHPQGGVMDFQSNVLTNTGTLTGYGTLKAALIVNQSRATFQGGETSIQSVYLNSAGATTEVLHASASFFYAFTNASGAYFKNTGSQITFFGVASIGGTYVSDPAMNVFNSALNLSGVLAGGPGDVFVFNDDFTSTNPDGLQLAGAKVVFNAGAHTFTLTGVTSIGTLELSDGASVSLVGADLFVGVLNADTNQFTTAQTIYYDPTQNPSLGAQTYALNGGGSLTAVPEPSSAMLVLLGVAAALCRRVGKRPVGAGRLQQH